jgi:hypothetical protein
MPGATACRELLYNPSENPPNLIMSDKMQFSPTFSIFSLTFLVQKNLIFSPKKCNLVRKAFFKIQPLIFDSL